MVIGGFIAGWFQTFTIEQTTEISESAKAKCNYARLTDKNQIYDSTQNLLKFQVENTGTADVEIQKIQIIYDDDTSVVANFTKATVRAGELLSIKENYTNSDVLIRADIKSVRIVTECPEVSFTLDGDDIYGAS